MKGTMSKSLLVNIDLSVLFIVHDPPSIANLLDVGKQKSRVQNI